MHKIAALFFLLIASPAWAEEPTWTTNVQVRFKIGDFSDALWFSAEDYTKQTADTLKAAMQMRYDAYQARVKNPPAPTKNELQAQIESVEGQIADLTALKNGGADAQIAELEKQKSALEVAKEQAQ
jgi:hypothetical protein